MSSIMPYYGKEFSFCQLQCNDNSTEQVCHIDKEKETLYLITNQGNYYNSKINGLNTKIDFNVSLFDKVSQKQKFQ